MLDLIRGGTRSCFSRPRFSPLFTHLETKAAGKGRRGRAGAGFCAGCGANLFRRVFCEKRPPSKPRGHSADLLWHLRSGAGRKEKLLSGLGCLSAPLETLDPEWDPLIRALHARPAGRALVAVPIVCHSAPPVAFCSQTLPQVVWAGFGEGIVLLMKQSGHYTARPGDGDKGPASGQPGTPTVTAGCAGFRGVLFRGSLNGPRCEDKAARSLC